MIEKGVKYKEKTGRNKSIFMKGSLISSRLPAQCIMIATLDGQVVFCDTLVQYTHNDVLRVLSINSHLLPSFYVDILIQGVPKKVEMFLIVLDK